MDINSLTQSSTETATLESTVTGNGQSAQEMSTMFLELLVAQISNQNPLEPMDGTEYVSQLAEFANVESLQSINQNTSSSLSYMNSLMVLEATNMVGESVDVLADSIALENPGSVSGKFFSSTRSPLLL